MREWLKKERLKKKMSQEILADLAEISRVYYTQIELGKRDPAPKVAIKIAKVLNISWHRFYEHLENKS